MKGIQKEFKLKLIMDEKEEEIIVRMSNISPLKIADIVTETSTVEKGMVRFKHGSFLQKSVDEGVVISPKNLIEQIEDADNGTIAVVMAFKEIYSFLSSPKKYKFEGEAISEQES